MATCTFFGHRDCPETIKPKLREALVGLITNHGVDMFYVGNQGHFDYYVRCVLRDLKQEYPHIQYAVVLAYMHGGYVSQAQDSGFGAQRLHQRFGYDTGHECGTRFRRSEFYE